MSCGDETKHLKDDPDYPNGPAPVDTGLDGVGAQPSQGIGSFTKLYRVPQDNFWKLEERLKLLQKKAKKLKCGAINYEVKGEEFVQHADGTATCYMNVEISGEAPKLNGWRFVGTLQHTESGNLLRSLPGSEIPQDYREQAPFCSHCQKKRSRKDTYIVVNDEGQYRQVGKQCLKDFTGHESPQDAAAAAELVLAAQELSEEDPEDDYAPKMGKSASYISAQHYLAAVITAIKENGWKSRKDVMSGGEGLATCDIAANTLFSTYEPFHPTEEQLKEADKMLKSVRQELMDKPNLDNFEWNMLTSIRGDYIPPRSFGIVATVAVRYMKSKEKQAAYAKKVAESTSKYVGQPGERRMFPKLTVVSSFPKDNYPHGISYATNLVDEQGNKLFWFTSVELEVGRSYQGKATIREHKLFNGEQETIIQRFSAELLPDDDLPAEEPK